MKIRWIENILLSAGLLAVLTACGSSFSPTADPPGQPTESAPTPQIVKETVLVVVTTTPLALPTATPGQPTVTSGQPTVAATPKPSPTSLALRNIPIEGGDKNNMFFAALVFPDFQPVASAYLWFRVYAHKPMSSKVDGEGIASVSFYIRNSKGQEVYYREEKTAGYCAFGGGEPDCLVWNFAEHDYLWPDGGKIVSDTYTIEINAISKDAVDMFGEAQFKVKVP